MSLKFTPLRVQKLVQETPDALTIHFEKPAAPEFSYTAGQYLTLKLTVNGESLRRAYSLCTSPLTDSTLAVTVKRVEGGRVSNHLATALREGDTLEVFPPLGNFKVAPEAGRARHYVLVGGGSGITPLMSILKTVLTAEPGSRITLLYANRDENSIIFRQALRDLEAAHSSRLRILWALDEAPAGWPGLTGRLSRHQLLSLFQDVIKSDALPKGFYICGPAGLMEETQASLGFLGVRKEDIFREVFTAALPDPDEKPAVNHEKKRGTYQVTVILDDKEQTVTVAPNASILDAVIREGLDPPYACQMGVCCTCRAKVKRGAVEMDEDEGLSDAEIEEGFVLTCQSHPLTPDVIVEFG